MTQEIHILNVRLPRDVIEWIDSQVKAGVYNSRSEAIRNFVRDSLREVEK
ncbi:ribbon-helix-helix domain-containing protein [Candidatus Woesearchaeota archaeon]|jgi:Arc/MetJ-type ribon-helix-helix transcriptional regulator|nr:ribbon-helix-helix domain-containing protein [Candidatus Woesearchaeota archaeon]